MCCFSEVFTTILKIIVNKLGKYNLATYICKTKANNMTITTNTTETLIRVRIYPFDFDGSKSNMTYVCYVKSLEDAEKKGWKYEIAE